MLYTCLFCFITGGEIQGGEVQGTSSRGNFVAKLNPSLVVDWSEVLRIVNDGSAQIADARSLARFLGQVRVARVYPIDNIQRTTQPIIPC